MRLFRICLMLGCLGVSACGGGVDLSEWVGMYQVSLHERNDTGCDGQGIAVQEEPYFQLEEEEFIAGTKYLSLSYCTENNAHPCRGGGLRGDSFTEEAEGGLDGRMGVATFIEPDCTLTYRQLTLRRLAPEQVRIQKRTYQDEPIISQEQCDADEALSRATAMPCTQLETLEGQRLGD